MRTPGLLFSCLLILLTPSFVRADTSQFVFTTEERTVAVDTISDAITIQSQDSSGASSPASETIDLVFTSTSATGEFVNSSGNAATKYMSTNTANRTFYYRDSVAGTHTITVEGTGRTSGKNWSVSQNIVVGSGGTNTTATQTQTTTSQSSSSSSSSQSSTYAPVGNNASLEVSIGSDRVASPGNALSFVATIKKQTNLSSKLDLSWSFGDGHVGSGERVEHAYKYPGNYVVVLNAKAGDVSSLARVKVTVGDAKVRLVEGMNYIDIVNEGSAEINLFKWKIEKNGMGFIFQPDTIILPNATMRFDTALLNMTGDKRLTNVTTLKNAVGDTVAQILYEMSAPTPPITPVSPLSYNYKAPALPTNTTKGVVAGTTTIATTTSNKEVVLYEAPDQKGVFSRIGSFFKGLFSRKVD